MSEPIDKIRKDLQVKGAKKKKKDVKRRLAYLQEACTELNALINDKKYPGYKRLLLELHQSALDLRKSAFYECKDTKDYLLRVLPLDGKIELIEVILSTPESMFEELRKVLEGVDLGEGE